MKKKTINIIGSIVLSVFIVGLASIMAGGFGAFLGICIVVAVLARFLGYLGLYALPSAANKLTKWVIFIAIISILAIWGNNLLEKKVAEQKTAQLNLQAQAQAEFQKKLQKFYLPPCDAKGECEEVPTVDAGPGTKHRIRADAPYRAVSVQPDGKRITYNMPAGWESWTGAAPAGKLRLLNTKGAKTEILVEVLREQ